MIHATLVVNNLSMKDVLTCRTSYAKLSHQRICNIEIQSTMLASFLGVPCALCLSNCRQGVPRTLMRSLITSKSIQMWMTLRCWSLSLLGVVCLVATPAVSFWTAALKPSPTQNPQLIVCKVAHIPSRHTSSHWPSRLQSTLQPR